MLQNFKFSRLILIFCLMFSMTALVFADTIRLKDGSIIKGKIINFDNGNFTVVIGEGSRQRQMNFRADQVASIVFDKQEMPVEVVNASGSPPSYTKDTSSNTTVITVGKNGNNNPTTPSPSVNTNTKVDDDVITDDDVVADNKNNSNTSVRMQPIRIDAKVLADNTANGWTNSGWVVRKGQRIRIVSNGRISLGGGRYTTANGISSLPDANKLIKDKPTGGLVAVVGDDNNDFIFIGENIEFVADRDGALFLGVNEGNLNDNSGAFDVKIEIIME